MDINKLSTGDRVIGVSGLVLFIFSFFDWLGLDIAARTSASSAYITGGLTKSAWGFPMTLIAMILALLMVLLVVLKLAGAPFSELGTLTWGHVLFGLGSVAFILILVKLIIAPSQWSANGVTVSLSQLQRLCRASSRCDSVTKARKFGIIIGCIAAGGLVVGGFLRMREDHAAPRETAGADST